MSISNAATNLYGLPEEHFKDLDQFYIELLAYNALKASQFPESEYFAGVDGIVERGLDPKNFKFEDPYFHLVNACKLNFPDGVFDLDKRGYPNTTARRIIKAWCDNDDIALAGAASLSKTYTVSGIVYLDWASAADSTMTLVGSTGISAASDRIWGQTCNLYRESRYTVGKLIDYKNMIVFGNFSEEGSDREYLNSIKAIALPKGSEGAAVIASLRGRKNKRVVVVYDEMAEMDLNVSDVRINLSGISHRQFVGIANPTPGLNPHTELCLPDDPRGFDAVNAEMEEWRTRTGVCVFLNGDYSPNFQAPPEEIPPFPYLLTRKKQATMLKMAYGNDRAIEYVRNAKGFTFQASSTECTVLSKDVIRQADIAIEPLWNQRPVKFLGSLDPAFTSGGDACVGTWGKLGYIRQTNKRAGFMVEQKQYFANVGEIYEDSIAVQVVDDMVKYKVASEDFGLDISSDGGKVATAIIKELVKRGYPNPAGIKAISSMGKPSEKKVSNEDKRLCVDAYDRLVTEYWMNTAIAVRLRCVFGLFENSDAANQLCQRNYLPVGKTRIGVETKKEMKKRVKRSPDNADSFCYWVFMLIKAGMTLVGDSEAAKVLRDFYADSVPASQKKERAYNDYSENDWGE